MKIELIKPVVRMGNSSCVMLPKEWLNGKARVELIDEPINIKEDVFKILNPYLKETRGIYLVGSHARGEQTEESDVDILAITEKECKRLKKGKYEIILISEEKLKEVLKKNILPLLPMIKEAKAILNENLIKEYKKTRITKQSLRWHIATTKSALNLQKELIKLSEEQGEKISDGIMYSLILRLREEHIINSLKHNQNYTIKDFKNLIKKLTGSEKSYNAYLRSKRGEREKKDIEPKTARKIYDHLKKEIKLQEEWQEKKQ